MYGVQRYKYFWRPSVTWVWKNWKLADYLGLRNSLRRQILRLAMDMPGLKSLKILQKFWRNIPENFTAQRFKVTYIKSSNMFRLLFKRQRVMELCKALDTNQHVLGTSWVFKKSSRRFLVNWKTYENDFKSLYRKT